jgi:hypothetical protein
MLTSPSCGENAGGGEDVLTTLWAAIPRPFRPAAAPPASLLRALPDTVLGYYFETHFEPGSAGAFRDLLVQVPLLRLGPPGPGSGPLCRFVERLQAWFATSPHTLGCPPLAWLELDDVAGNWQGRHPGLSICVDEHFHPHRVPGAGRGLPAPTLRALVEELDQLCDSPSRAAATIEHLAEQWPKGGRVRHLSIMAGRSGQPRKLYGIVPRAELLPFLERVRWPGDLESVIDLQAALPETLVNLHVDLTVMGSLLTPRLAFELFSEPPPYEDFSRRAAVSAAVARGWLPPDAPETLTAWLGQERRRLGHDTAPSRVLRWFDLKFCTDGRRAFAKAYLAAHIDGAAG